MRKDIQVNTTINDMVFQNTNNQTSYKFQWVSESDTCLFGEITLPRSFDIRQLQKDGVKIEIPYTPIYKPFQIKIVRKFDENSTMSVVNPINGSEWFEIYTKLWNHDNKKQLKASQLIIVSKNSYVIQIDNKEGIGYIWSATNTDAVNIRANIQNRNLLLQCVPSNNYRYPISGVGLVRFLHANLSQTMLAKVLRDEFKSDKVTVKRATFDTYTGDIDLDLDFSEADESV